MKRNRPPFLLVADVSALPASIAPVLRIFHVLVADGVSAAPCRDDVCEQYTHGLVGPVRLHGLGGCKSLNLPSLELVGDNGAEDAQAEFWTACETVCKLQEAGQRHHVACGLMGEARGTFSLLARCWGSWKAAFSRATTDSRSDMLSGLILGE